LINYNYYNYYNKWIQISSFGKDRAGPIFWAISPNSPYSKESRPEDKALYCDGTIRMESSGRKKYNGNAE